MPPDNFVSSLKQILAQYRESFTARAYNEENEDHDED